MKFGNVCPGCMAYHGAPNPGGYMDVERCVDCIAQKSKALLERYGLSKIKMKNGHQIGEARP